MASLSAQRVSGTAAAVMRWLLGSCLSPEGEEGRAHAGKPGSMVDALLPGLEELLQESDGAAATAAVALAAELLFRLAGPPRQWWAGEPLSFVERLLSSPKASAKRSGLSLVSALAAEATPSSGNGSSLVEHLVRLLGDTDISVRRSAAQALAKLPRPVALKPLVVRLGALEDRVRSAAAEGVLQVLTDSEEVGQVVEALLWALEETCSSATENSGTKGTAAQKRSADERARDELQRVARQWAGALEEHSREQLALALTEFVAQHPGNLHGVTLLSVWSSCLSAGTPLRIVLRAAVQQLRSEPMDPPAALTEEEQEEAGNSGSSALLRRLAPLLMLKVLHLGALDGLSNPDLYGPGGPAAVLPHHLGHWFVQQRDAVPPAGGTAPPLWGCADFLVHRMCSCGVEFEEVRRLSAELAGRLHPDIILPACSSLLAGAVTPPQRDLALIRTACFVWCTALAARPSLLQHPAGVLCPASSRVAPSAAGGDNRAEGQGAVPEWVPLRPCGLCCKSQVAHSLRMVLEWEARSDSADLRKTHMGAMDCLSLLALAELSMGRYESRNRQARIQEIVPRDAAGEGGAGGCGSLQHGADKAGVLTMVMDELLGRLQLAGQEKACPSQLRICMANVLIMLSQRLEPSGGAFAGFRVEVLEPLSSAGAALLREGGGSGDLLALFLQVMFTGVHKIGSEVGDLCKPLLELVEGCLQGPDVADGARLASTKLLAALLSLPGEALETAAPQVDRLCPLVRSAACMDRSPDLRAVCEKLAACMQ